MTRNRDGFIELSGRPVAIVQPIAMQAADPHIQRAFENVGARRTHWLPESHNRGKLIRIRSRSVEPDIVLDPNDINTVFRYFGQEGVDKMLRDEIEGTVG